MAADLTDAEVPQALWRATLAWRGRINVLVNNAAVYEAEPAFADDPAWAPAWRAVWQRIMQINIAPAELAMLAVAHFRARGEGGILIHLSSRAAHRGEKPLLGSYAASKGTLNALSHTIARNEGASGILSYAVAPGWVGTDMSWNYIEETGDRGPLAENALGTLIPPEEVANIVVFLASGAARHATGTVIDINGASFPRWGIEDNVTKESILDDLTRKAIMEAIRECGEIGINAFLMKHEAIKCRTKAYFICHNKREYDIKIITYVALLPPSEGQKIPHSPKVEKAVEEHGFTVMHTANAPSTRRKKSRVQAHEGKKVWAIQKKLERNRELASAAIHGFFARQNRRTWVPGTR